MGSENFEDPGAPERVSEVCPDCLVDHAEAEGHGDVYFANRRKYSKGPKWRAWKAHRAWLDRRYRRHGRGLVGLYHGLGGRSMYRQRHRRNIKDFSVNVWGRGECPVAAIKYVARASYPRALDGNHLTVAMAENYCLDARRLRELDL